MTQTPLTTANRIDGRPSETARLRESNEELLAALEAIECIHDGNPPLALADMPEIDYARRQLFEARRIASTAITNATNPQPRKETEK